MRNGTAGDERQRQRRAQDLPAALALEPSIVRRSDVIVLSPRVPAGARADRGDKRRRERRPLVRGRCRDSNPAKPCTPAGIRRGRHEAAGPSGRARQGYARRGTSGDVVSRAFGPGRRYSATASITPTQWLTPRRPAAKSRHAVEHLVREPADIEDVVPLDRLRRRRRLDVDAAPAARRGLRRRKTLPLRASSPSRVPAVASTHDSLSETIDDQVAASPGGR